MNQRELSQKLDELATQLEEICTSTNQNEKIMWNVAQELRKLSNENYAPGNGVTWDAIKPKPAKPQGGFISKSGKKLPF